MPNESLCKARQLSTNGMSDVLRVKVNDRVINAQTLADVNSISCSDVAAAGRAVVKKLHGSRTLTKEVFVGYYYISLDNVQELIRR